MSSLRLPCLPERRSQFIGGVRPFGRRFGNVAIGLVQSNRSVRQLVYRGNPTAN